MIKSEGIYNKNLPQFTDKKLIGIIKPYNNKNFVPTTLNRNPKKKSNNVTTSKNSIYITNFAVTPLAKFLDEEHNKNISKQKSIDFRQIPNIIKSNTILVSKKKNY